MGGPTNNNMASSAPQSAPIVDSAVGGAQRSSVEEKEGEPGHLSAPPLREESNGDDEVRLV